MGYRMGMGWWAISWSFRLSQWGLMGIVEQEIIFCDFDGCTGGVLI
jgi:hypothetical protein